VSRLSVIFEKLGIEVDPQLIDLAFTHRSWAYENGRGPTNERLEFLGDSVLGLVVTEHIYHTYPDRTEGQLAKVRAAVVSGATLARKAKELDLGAQVKLGKGEIATKGESKDSILADTMEAVIGAVHLAGGLDASAGLIHELLDSEITHVGELGAALDWKSSLQELMASQGLGTPDYFCEAFGPDHERTYQASLCIQGEQRGQGSASSKRAAEQNAAEVAYGYLMGLTGE